MLSTGQPPRCVYMDHTSGVVLGCPTCTLQELNCQCGNTRSLLSMFWPHREATLIPNHDGLPNIRLTPTWGLDVG